jgi:hypothetical protein
MTYLLSLLTTASSSKESNQILCYYINETNDVQIVRMMNGVACNFERIVFAEERILFRALSEAHLEVYSFLTYGAQSSKVDCRSLRVNQESDLARLL